MTSLPESASDNATSTADPALSSPRIDPFSLPLSRRAAWSDFALIAVLELLLSRTHYASWIFARPGDYSESAWYWAFDMSVSAILMLTSVGLMNASRCLGPAALGLDLKRVRRQIVWGVLTALVLFLIVALVLGAFLGIIVLQSPSHSPPQAFHQMERHIPKPMEQVPAPALLVLAFAAAVGEEVASRAFIFPRLCLGTGRPWLAALISSLLFALPHSWQGSTGVVGAFLMGLVTCFVFYRTRSLIAVITAHFLFDIRPLLLLLIT